MTEFIIIDILQRPFWPLFFYGSAKNNVGE